MAEANPEPGLGGGGEEAAEEQSLMPEPQGGMRSEQSGWTPGPMKTITAIIWGGRGRRGGGEREREEKR